MLAAAIALALVSTAVVADEPRCVKWRATSGCDPAGPRDSWYDASCSSTIQSGSSGYCECENRRRVREVDCDHHPFTCQDACKEDASAELHYPAGMEYVTCGSTIKLVHEASRFRLHSHEVNYGTGSGQQSVTAHGSRDDYNSYWLVKEGDGDAACSLGAKIACGATIRLEHINTRRNLHSHHFASPLSNGRFGEVSGFGVAGDGDRSDSWILECESGMQCKAGDEACANGAAPSWARDDLVRLRHVETQRYLHSDHAASFNNQNCPRCPIVGQQEVNAVPTKNDNGLWFAGEGIYVG
ncbi:hypothetical protein SPRG_01524 [Saprolegnia parasitica CBS 223.65]|uniref:MIR domain-containing protein n=1 Tax=Saprolegnia parasitica (strain CBS 223.65) TaxID=695850 RepID=A0A067CV48_SAPPC|nr:hypothetical protein SPRG_01524 [Saprolegnia parasitica CBS 223.65]KDO34388.1 hypothetical protein SPRG_01524 [Saprolegnia parasitica CBS 223.65]|eukprot:XP_012195124.1 hypothetical protein SPRG_01524 [Saprolegnia parasitica CBS 223.65]